MNDSIPQTVHQMLQRYGQTHLLRWWEEFDGAARQSLLMQIEAVDFERIEQLLDERRSGSDGTETPADRARRAGPPSDLVRLPEAGGDKAEWAEARRRGEQLLRDGKVGVILVAGGQGTRLEFPHPKGMFPIGPVSGSSLFQILAEQLLARSRRVARPESAKGVDPATFGHAHPVGLGVPPHSIPYFIMTSEATHDETVAFFEEHACFGLNRDDVFFFQQGTMPAVDAETGRLLLAEKGRLATSPDGHGGVLQALAKAGLLDEMRDRGVEVLFYHQVDNPTAIVCDPAFLGLHVMRGSEMSTKVVPKRSPEEKMGVLVDVDGKTQVIEYSDLPDDVARKTDETGQLLLWAGSTAIHAFHRSFLERLARSDVGLPFHLAHKKVPCLDDSGRRIEPDEPNAYKFERFIFDALPFAETALVVEADRDREFNPVKNRTGSDSPETARQALLRMHREWLRSAGAEGPEDVPVEISPLFALDADEVRRKVRRGSRFDSPTYLDDNVEAPFS